MNPSSSPNVERRRSVVSAALAVLLVLLPLFGSAAAREIRARIDPGGPLAREGLASEDAHLPVAIRTFAIPEGFEVAAIRATPHGEIPIARRAAPPVPAISLPVEALDRTASWFPSRSAVSLASGLVAGRRLHTVGIFPVRWNRRTGELVRARSLDLEITLRPASTPSGLVRLRESESAARAIRDALAAIVENPADLASLSPGPAAAGGFAPRELPSVEGSAVDLVIVTTAALGPSFEPLVDWKTRKGVPAVIRTLEWIDANYPAGHDRPERVRLFLQDAYSKWGTFLVLVGGDFEDVTPRFARNNHFLGGTDIPCDQYWACLDGNWNADGDAYYGEGFLDSEPGDDADLYPDLFIGRAPVSTPAEVATFVAKSLTYDTAPPAGYVEDVCHFSEVLFPGDWVYGDPPEEIEVDGKALVESLDVHIDSTWTRTMCTQSDNTQDRSHALAELQAGHHLLTLVNHGDAFKFSVGNGLNPFIYSADTDVLTNGDRLMVVLATVCSPNQFDLESCGESLVNNPAGGAVAVIGPTRSDFPGPAAAFNEEVLESIFAHGVTGFGAASQVSRIPFLYLAGSDGNVNRWNVLTKLLLGDPELRIWTREPSELFVSHAPVVPLTADAITVIVSDGAAAPVADARVCVSDGNGTYSRSRTDAAGVAVLPLGSAGPGAVSVVVTKEEFLPRETTFTIEPVGAPDLTLADAVIDDDASGASAGNGDGVPDAGETIELFLHVHNGGDSPAANVRGSAKIEAGSGATFDLVYGGARDAGVVHIGPGRAHPDTVPFALDFADPAAAYAGTPNLTWAADPSADRGFFLWQDEAGWHLWWSGGPDPVDVSGTIVTDGRVRPTPSLDLESTDLVNLAATADTLTFVASTHATDLFDRLNFTLADSTAVTLVAASANFGEIAPAASVTEAVVLEISPAARSGQIAAVELMLASTSGGPWSARVPLVFAGPALEAYVLAVDDSENPPNTSGNGNGVLEPGETVRVTPTVLNRGTGEAGGVTGTVTADGGIAFADSTDFYGDLPAAGQSEGTNGYVFTIEDSTAAAIELTLTDDLGRTWDKQVEFLAPAPPESLAFTSTPEQIVVTWAPTSAPDLAGYNLYRSATGDDWARQNFELLRAGGRYVDENLPIGSRFYYRSAAVDSSGNESPASDELFAWTTHAQVDGWPQGAGDFVFSSIGIADADGDGPAELYVGSFDFDFHGWGADGSDRPGFPVPANGAIWATPALADIDGDEDLELFWGANDSRFYAVHHDGSPVFGSDPVLLDLGGTGSLVRSAVTVADVDGDEDLEILFGTDQGTVYAFHHDGTGLADSTGLLFAAQPAGAASRIWGPIAIAAGSGSDARIAFASWNDSLYVVTPGGDLVPGFPRGAEDDFLAGVVVGDLDCDGHQEFLAGNDDDNLYAFRHDGSDYLPGGVFAAFSREIRGVPALCQLDGDPELEVVVGCLDGNLYAFHHDGTGFTSPDGMFVDFESVDGISASPIVVDVDGDGDFEILVGHRDGNFYAFHHDGSLVVGMPFPVNDGIYSTAAAGDLDADGDVDVAFASFDQSVNVIDFPGASSPEAYEWPTYAGNNARTSVYQKPGSPVGIGSGPSRVALALDQNVPNPFGAGTVIRYVVPEGTEAVLAIFDVTGRLVRTLVDGTAAAGAGSVTWDGRDGAGRPVSSGVYFYRIDAGGERLSRKTVVLK